MNISLEHKGRKIFLYVRKSRGIIGLMFARREDAHALLFNFGTNKQISLHSFFVFFPFLAIWLDEKNKILEIKVVKPFSFNIFSKKPFSKVVEIPLNRKYKKIIKKLVGKRKI